MMTLFAFFEIAFCPSKYVSMGNDEKNFLYTQARRLKTRLRSRRLLNSSTLGVIGLAPRRRWHSQARAATGQGHVAGQRGQFGRR